MRPEAVEQTLEVIGRKWIVAVLAELHKGPRRRNELARTIDDGIPGRVLTDTLRHMQRDGVVERHTLDLSPPAVQYRLTALGHSLIDPLQALDDWASVHSDTVEHARSRFDTRPSDADAKPPRRE